MTGHRWRAAMLAALAAGLLWACAGGVGQSRQAQTPGAGGGFARLAAPATARTSPTTTSSSQATSAASARRVHVLVAGVVQGVGFRAFTQNAALKLQLAGWVKNLPDGRVEAVVEGPPDRLAELLKAMGKGPSGARVDKLEVKDEPFQGEFRTFEVRR